jgi:hypothetical protein
VLPRHRLPHHGPDSLKIAIRQNDHQSAVHDFGDQILGRSERRDRYRMIWARRILRKPTDFTIT